MKIFLKPGPMAFFWILSMGVGCRLPDKSGPQQILGQPPFEALTDSIQRFPRDPALYFRRAGLLSQNNFHEMASADYKESWDLHPTEETGIRLASSLSITGRANEEVKLLLDAIRLFPGSHECKRLLAESYMQNGKIKEAVGIYDGVLKNDSLDFEAWYEKGELMAEAKDTPAALAALTKAVSIQPVNTYALELAHLYAEIKNPAALDICDKVLQNDSSRELVDPFFIKGIYYSNTQQYDAATVAFDSCIRRDWKFTDAYIEKGVALYKQKNYDAALNTFRLAATVSNTNADAYFWIGRCYEAAHKKLEAAEYYQRAVELDHNFPEAKEALKRVSNSGA